MGRGRCQITSRPIQVIIAFHLSGDLARPVPWRFQKRLFNDLHEPQDRGSFALWRILKMGPRQCWQEASAAEAPLVVFASLFLHRVPRRRRGAARECDRHVLCRSPVPLCVAFGCLRAKTCRSQMHSAFSGQFCQPRPIKDRFRRDFHFEVWRRVLSFLIDIFIKRSLFAAGPNFRDLFVQRNNAIAHGRSLLLGGLLQTHSRPLKLGCDQPLCNPPNSVPLLIVEPGEIGKARTRSLPRAG